MPYINLTGYNYQMKEEPVFIVYSSENKFIIKKHNLGYYCKVRPRSLIKYWKELWSDWIGDTYIHPKWLINNYFDTIEQIITIIKYSTSIV